MGVMNMRIGGFIQRFEGIRGRGGGGGGGWGGEGIGHGCEREWCRACVTSVICGSHPPIE